MSSHPFPETPAASGQRLYEQRTEKGTFINPPGYEHSFAVHSWGRANMQMTQWPWRGMSRDRGMNRSAEEFAMMRKRRGLEGESLSVKGRPLK